MRTKDMSVLREAPSFKALAKRTKTGGWNLPMRDYSLDGLLSIEGNIEKLGHNFFLHIDDESQIVAVAPFSKAVNDVVNGGVFRAGKLALTRIPETENPEAYVQMMCTLIIGKNRAILDLEELLSYTRLV